MNRADIPTPLTDSEGFSRFTAREIEKDRTELIDALDYWLNGQQKSQARFAEDSEMLARMKERK